MNALYKDAHLKIERANKHIADLEAAIFEMENTYRATIEQHPDFGAQSVKHEIPDIEKAFDNLSVIIGDALHNLHCALDFAWYSTINRCLPDKLSQCTKFPVRDSSQSLEATLHGIEVDTRCKPLFDCIVSTIQPYKGGHNSVIWTLHDLDISDKHLLLLEPTPQAYIRGIVVRDQSGQTHRGNTWATQSPSPWRIDFESGITIEDKGKLFVGITLSEAGIYKGVPVHSLLSSFSQYILYTVNLLENI